MLLGPDSLRGGLAEGNRIAVCRWSNGIWCVHKLPQQFSTLYRSKMDNFAKNLFDIVITHNDETSYVKHVLDPVCVFFTLSGCGGGGRWASKGAVAQPAYAVSNLGSSKMVITSQRLLDQSQAGIYRGKCHIPPHFGPFGAYSHTPPQGVELLV